MTNIIPLLVEFHWEPIITALVIIILFYLHTVLRRLQKLEEMVSFIRGKLSIDDDK